MRHNHSNDWGNLYLNRAARTLPGRTFQDTQPQYSKMTSVDVRAFFLASLELREPVPPRTKIRAVPGVHVFTKKQHLA